MQDHAPGVDAPGGERYSTPMNPHDDKVTEMSAHNTLQVITAIESQEDNMAKYRAEDAALEEAAKAYTVGERVTTPQHCGYRTLYAITQGEELVAFVGMKTGWGAGHPVKLRRAAQPWGLQSPQVSATVRPWTHTTPLTTYAALMTQWNAPGATSAS